MASKYSILESFQPWRFQYSTALDSSWSFSPAGAWRARGKCMWGNVHLECLQCLPTSSPLSPHSRTKTKQPPQDFFSLNTPLALSLHAVWFFCLMPNRWILQRQANTGTTCTISGSKRKLLGTLNASNSWKLSTLRFQYSLGLFLKSFTILASINRRGQIYAR